MDFSPRHSTLTLIELLGLKHYRSIMKRPAQEPGAVWSACEELRERRILKFDGNYHYKQWVLPEDADLINALRACLADNVGTPAAKKIASVLILCGLREESLVPHLSLWCQVPFIWRRKGMLADDIVRELRALNFSEDADGTVPLIHELLKDPFVATRWGDDGFRLRSKLFAGRLIHCSLRDDSYTPEHHEIFAAFAGAAEPAVQIGEVEQGMVLNEPFRTVCDSIPITTRTADGVDRVVDLQAEMPDVSAVIELNDDDAYLVSFEFQGKRREFQAQNLGRFADTRAVMTNFNAFMSEIDRCERVVRLDEVPDHQVEWFGEFLVADATCLRSLQTRLGIPFEYGSSGEPAPMTLS